MGQSAMGNEALNWDGLSLQMVRSKVRRLHLQAKYNDTVFFCMTRVIHVYSHDCTKSYYSIEYSIRFQ